MLEVKNLTKVFRKKDEKTKEIKEAGIWDLSFEARPGRIFGLIGANGAGKTTTMRMLANLTSPQSGTISLNGKSYTTIPEVKRYLGFVSGETQVFDRLTPAEILNIYGKLAGIPGSTLSKRIDGLVEKLKMEEFINTRISNFSTGMKQKVSIARALITNPEVLIFDEITNGLDIFAAKSVKDIIYDLQKDGKIIIFSTHIMPDADELCDDLAIIHKGKIIAQGERKTLLTKNGVGNISELFFKLIKQVDPELVI